MIPEIAHFALILAFVVAITQSVVPLVGAARNDVAMMDYGRISARLQGLLTTVAFFGLMLCFYRNDFSVMYVAEHSNSRLPTPYRLSGVWGGHEGSILLWLTVLGGWSAAVAQLGGNLPRSLLARVLAAMGWVSTGLTAFVLFTSNPFHRIFPAVPEGNDLNPLLQDPGMVMHPPMLYIGYVGFSVVFAFAVAALIERRFDAEWARWTRPWTLAAWCFLTLGIALGSYWAYYELGWGGWWFWDPVENASFMPWITGTALLHSLAVSDKRDELKVWTLLLAIVTFALSLLGTFLVRSGVLTSVHAFASDPRRGIFILLLLAFFTGISLLLFAQRAPQMARGVRFSLLSREAMLLLGNVILLVTCATVLLGTLYPLVLDALGLGKLSVGAPYFEAVFVPLMAPVVILAGIGSVARWQRNTVAELVRALRWEAVAAVAVAAVLPFFLGGWKPLVAVGVLLCSWVGLISLKRLAAIVRQRKQVSLSVVGMLLAHFGIAVFIFGVTAVKGYDRSAELRMAVGDHYTLGGYAFTLVGLHEAQGPNYVAMVGDVEVRRNGGLTLLHPEKRIYASQPMPMTEAAIDSGFTRDLYIALGEQLDGGAWGVRIQVKPFVNLIWIGCLIMALGGLVAALDRRFKSAQRRAAASMNSLAS